MDARPTQAMLALLRDMQKGLRLRCQRGDWYLYVPGGGCHPIRSATAMGCVYRGLIRADTDDLGLYTLTKAGRDAMEDRQ